MLATSSIVLGIILLLFGRKLFWFFVGVIGFLTGVLLATHYLQGQPEWVILIIALIAGVLGPFWPVWWNAWQWKSSVFWAGVTLPWIAPPVKAWKWSVFLVAVSGWRSNRRFIGGDSVGLGSHLDFLIGRVPLNYPEYPF